MLLIKIFRQQLIFRDKRIVLFKNLVGEIFGIFKKKDIKIKSRHKKIPVFLTNVQ